MGYGRFMGYAMHFPAHQVGGHKMLWDKRGYGFAEVWVKRGSTVITKTSGKNVIGVWDVRHYHQGLLQGPSQKGNLTWFDQKSEEKFYLSESM